MPLVDAKCTNCGATLKVDNAREAAICEHCGSAFIVEKAIQNFTYQIGRAEVVNIFGDVAKDFKITAGVLTKYSGEAVDIVVPDNVRDIGHAFRWMKFLNSITLPAGLREIPSGAFSGCQYLQSVHLAEGITAIGSEAFSGCSHLKTINFPASLRSIGEKAFSGCEALTDIRLSEGITCIGKEAFSESCLENIWLPDSLQEIGEGAFQSLKGLKTIQLPRGIRKIGDSAFQHCANLQEVTLRQAGIPAQGASQPGEIGQFAFYQCTALRRFCLPDGVGKIGGYAFRECESLREFPAHNGLTDVGIGAFYRCSGLREVRLPDGLRLLGELAFSECTGITRVYFPENVEAVGEAAFQGCHSLAEVYFHAIEPRMGDCIFWDCENINYVEDDYGNLYDLCWSMPHSAFCQEVRPYMQRAYRRGRCPYCDTPYNLLSSLVSGLVCKYCGRDGKQCYDVRPEVKSHQKNGRTEFFPGKHR